MTTVKKNQPNMHEAITYYFEEKFKRNPQLAPDFVSRTGDDDADRRTVKHGRHEIRKIWVSTDLNEYLANEIGFPAVGQVYAIHRTRITYKKKKKTGFSQEWDFGITSHSAERADAKTLLRYDRNHWSIEVMHRQIDETSTYDEDRCRIRTGNGAENFSTLRRFAIAVVRRHNDSFAPVLRRLMRDSRLMLDYLCLTANTNRRKSRCSAAAVQCAA